MGKVWDDATILFTFKEYLTFIKELNMGCPKTLLLSLLGTHPCPLLPPGVSGPPSSPSLQNINSEEVPTFPCFDWQFHHPIIANTR